MLPRGRVMTPDTPAPSLGETPPGLWWSVDASTDEPEVSDPRLDAWLSGDVSGYWPEPGDA